MNMRLREYQVSLKRLLEGAPSVDPDDLGCRTKLGGSPDWEQEDEYPRCPHCTESMSFVAQIDSVEHQSEDNPHSIDPLSPEQQYMFADVGMIYVFFCFECSEPTALLQSY